MMKKLTLMVGLLALTAMPVLAEEALVAYFNFNYDPLPGGGFGYLADPDAFPLVANDGIGNATLTVGGGIFDETTVTNGGDTVYRWIQSFGGTTINALYGDPTGGALSPQGGTLVDEEAPNNGGYVEIAFDMTGLSGLSVSYATRGTATGFTDHTWSWSTDGINFTDFDFVTGTNAGVFFLVELPLLSALDDVSTAFLRLTLDGATGPTGNNRIDNLVLMVDEAVSAENQTLSNVKSLFR